MQYYIVTTTKFANECLRSLTYGATQPNWLVNINVGDIIFLSQFNYKSQNLFGPFRVTKDLFYDKTIIYPQQRYFYRIHFKPIETIKAVEETDLYLFGIKSKNASTYFRIINLIQQNKHLHCICLTKDEGKAILNTFIQANTIYNNIEHLESKTNTDFIDVNCDYIGSKNKLDQRHYFSSESDLESFIILSLKNNRSKEYKSFSKLLNKFPNNELQFSEIYNQFIFGNAYPSDIVILNKDNINVFELKKDRLSRNIVPQIEKEIQKHLYYSLFSSRIKPNNIKRFNFYLVYLRDGCNKEFKRIIFEKYNLLCKRIYTKRENTITFAEYHEKDKVLFLEEV